MATDNKGKSKKLNTRKRNTRTVNNKPKPSTNEVNKLKELNTAFEAPKANKVSATKKEKPVKEKKPKRKLNAYMVFAMEVRQSVKNKNPTAKVTEIAVKIGELWRALSNSEKLKYKK